MGDYYKEKREALAIIDAMLAESKPIAAIYFKISTRFGFGKKIVDDRIKELKEIKNSIKNDDVLPQKDIISEEKDLKSDEIDPEIEAKETLKLITGVEI